MDIAGARTRAARVAAVLRLRRSRSGSGMRELASELSAALRAGPHPRPTYASCATRCAWR